jgi:hypothetical protein
MENQDELVWVALWMIGIVGILILTFHYWYWEIYKKRK